MKKQIPQAGKVLSTSLLPLAISGLSYLIEKVTSSFDWVNDQHPGDSLDNKRMVFLLQQIRSLMMGIYENYFAFLAVMIILHLGIHRFKSIKKSLRNKEMSFGDPQNITSSAEKSTSFVRDTLTLILCYTLSFYFLKLLIATIIPSFFIDPQSLTNQGQNQITQPRRMLGGVQTPAFVSVISEYYTTDPDMIPMHVLYSNDFKTAFVVHQSGVAVCNISEPSAPEIIGHFKDKESWDGYPSAAISAKNKIMLLDRDYVQIINITDRQNLSTISSFRFRTEDEMKNRQRSHPSIAISSDEKFAICTDPGFYIYDLSNISAPELVFSESQESTAVILSKDNRLAYVGGEDFMHVWNVTNWRKPKRIGNSYVGDTIMTLVLSKDEKTLYVKTNDEFGQTEWLYVYDVSSPWLPSNSYGPNISYSENIPLSSLKLSPDGTFMVVRNAKNVKLVTTQGRKYFIDLDYNLFPTYRYADFAFLPDSKRALIFSTGMIQLAEIHMNIPYNRSSSLQPNKIYEVSAKDLPRRIVAHPESFRAYILTEDPTNSNKKTIVNLGIDIGLSEVDYIRNDGTYSFNSSSNVLILSSDGSRIYYKSSEKILEVLNSNELTISRFTSIKLNEDFESFFVLSSDQSTLYTLNKENPLLCQISIYNISDPESPGKLSTISFPSVLRINESWYGSTNMILSQDEKTLFCLDQSFYVIDVSDQTNPRILSSFRFEADLTKTFTCTSDFKTCFVMITPFNDRKLLMVLDLIDYKAPKLLSEMYFPVDANYKLSVSGDNTLLFASSSEAFMTLDISNKSALVISEVQLVKTLTFGLVKDDNFVIVCNEDSFQLIRRKPKYALYISDEKFPLGRTYSNFIKVMELGKTDVYNPIGFPNPRLKKDYKFIQASLLNHEIKPLNKFAISYSPLPSWFSFNKENAIVDFDLTAPSKIASYKICFSMGTKVESSAFSSIKGFNYKENGKNLQVYLFGQGYLDSDQFLTPNFNENLPLLLSDEYAQFETEIRKTLKSRKTELITTISVEPSLELVLKKPLQIVTPSLNPISVKIELLSEQRAKFVTQAFSAIKVILDEKKKSLVLEGALLNINEALVKLLINVEDESEGCQGKITISDGLNPVQIHNFNKVSDFIETNKQPFSEKYSVQKQVESGPPIVAGEPFSIVFDTKTFADSNGRPLTYSLEMPDPKIVNPSWIALRGLTLMGTAPEDYLPYNVKFVIKAKNEYKSVLIPFNLSVKLSFWTYMKRLLILIGYVFTAYKFWQHSDKIYNMLMKRSYKYPKIFKVNVGGGEISEQNVFPILLIGTKTLELSNTLLKGLKSYLKLKDKELVEYFIDSQNQSQGIINRQKVVEEIENMVHQSVVDEDGKRLFAYQNEDVDNKEVIHQLIVNRLVLKRISMKSEKLTRTTFNKMKSKWADLVEFHNNLSGGFFVKDLKLAEELQLLNIDVANLLDNQYSAGDTEERLIRNSLSKELISKTDSRINIDLLKDAIIAHAFDCQNLKTSRNFIQIQSKELLSNSSGCLKSFFKSDMVDLMQNSTKHLGYGLKYEFVGNKIVFSGKLEGKIHNKAVVVQLITKRGWILREFVIKVEGNVVSDSRTQSFMTNAHDEL